MHWFAAPRLCFTAPKPCLAYFYKKSDPLTPVRSKYTFALPFVSDCCPNALLCLAQALLCCSLGLLCRAKSLLCLVQALPCLPRALLCCAQTLHCLAEALPCCAQGVLCCPRVLLCFAQALLCWAQGLAAAFKTKSDTTDYVYIYMCRMKEHAQSFKIIVNHCS